MNKKIFGLAIVCGGVMLTCFTCSLTYFVTKKTKIYDAFHAAKNTPIIAHRGYASQYMANTTEAFLAAATSKLFNGIETDIWFTKPDDTQANDTVFVFGEKYEFQHGVPVISHDPAPFVNEKRKITEMTWKEIEFKELDADNKSVPFKNKYRHSFEWNTTAPSKISWSPELYNRETTTDGTSSRTHQAYVIPTFADYITICWFHDMYPFIEIKQNSLDLKDKDNGFEENGIVLLSNDQLQDLPKLISEFPIQSLDSKTPSTFLSRCNFISFRHQYLDAIKNYVSTIQSQEDKPYYQILVSPLDSISKCYKLIDEGYSLSLMQAMIDEKIISYSHARHLMICGWTFDVIDNALTWSLYDVMGLDAITTDAELYLIS